RRDVPRQPAAHLPASARACRPRGLPRIHERATADRARRDQQDRGDGAAVPAALGAALDGGGGRFQSPAAADRTALSVRPSGVAAAATRSACFRLATGTRPKQRPCEVWAVSLAISRTRNDPPDTDPPSPYPPLPAPGPTP